MEYRLPYYMAYPMPQLYDDGREERRDYEYMKSMYPVLVKRILPYVEMECERMSYIGSMIFDEYPDQLQMRMMGKRVYNEIKESEKDIDATGEWLEHLVQVILYQELVRRRCEYRKKRNRFYL